MFLLLPHREALYGGAAGGGKSDALLMAALQYVDVPGYSAMLFRRTYADLTLPGALLDRAREWLQGTDAVWTEREKRWTFPSGATLTFGYLETENDKFRYQSTELQFIGFDELTQFEESRYRYLFSRLRRLANSELPIRMRAASNPGGRGHDWVKARFVDSGPERPFVRAVLSDNPSLDQDEYIESLSELDNITRRQLLEGDWKARVSGSLFRREWFRMVDLPPTDAEARVRYWDLASTEPEDGSDPDWTVGTRMSRSPGGLYTIEDVRRDRRRPAAVEQLVKDTAALDGTAIPIRIEQEPGASGKALVAHYVRILAGYDVRGDRPTGEKRVRAAPLSAQNEAGNIQLVRGAWNLPFLDELEAFTGDPKVDGHDDQVDSASGAFNAIAITRRPTWSEIYGSEEEEDRVSA